MKIKRWKSLTQTINAYKNNPNVPISYSRDRKQQQKV